MNWYKNTRLTQQGEIDKEIWIREENQRIDKYEVDVYLGKKTDLLSLKKNIVDKIKKNIKYYQESRTELYNQPQKEEVKYCPVCGASSENSELKTVIYGAKYVQCKQCTHVYVLKRPLQKTIHNFYLNNVTYAATYTDKEAAESRLQAIAVPWTEWMLKVFEKKYNRKPKRVLDVGSGAGHFVEACRRKGMEAYGIELSESSRNFAKEIWGFEMDGRNFLDVVDNYKDIDVITFWGLLEHTPNPGEILKTANRILSEGNGEGIVISKLPRWNSLSSAIQILSNNSVIRHLDPMGHIMAFTDSSAAEIYTRNNFSPIAAWYYGMDIYEMLMQIGNKVDSYEHFTKTGDLQVELQQFIDEVRYSDGLTFVGIPQKNI